MFIIGIKSALTLAASVTVIALTITSEVTRDVLKTTAMAAMVIIPLSVINQILKP